MENRRGGSSPLDELRRINEKVAQDKAAGNASPAPAESAAPTANACPAQAPNATAPVANARPAQTPNAAAPAANTRPAQTPNAATPTANARPVQAPAPQQRPVRQTAPAQAARPAPPQKTAPSAVYNAADGSSIPDLTAGRTAPQTPSATYNAPARQAQADNGSGTIVYSRSHLSDAAQKRPAPAPQSRAAQPAPTPAPAKTNTPASHISDTKKGGSYESEFEDTVGRGVVSSALKTVVYIVLVLIISGCLSLFTILVANDVFAFVKPDSEVTITLTEDADIGDIAKTLHENGVIKYPGIFKLYCKFRHKTASDYLAGDFTVSPNMGYDVLIAKFLPSTDTRKELTLTIIEGMTVDEIIDLFVENGIGTREQFVNVINNVEVDGKKQGEFDYWFVHELDTTLAKYPDTGRKYRLEGYLFPDTYNFYSNSSEYAVINKLLDNFNNKFDQKMRQTAESMGYTTDQIVIMASMIQREAKYVTDYGKVASVFYNRLNNPRRETNGYLQSDATVHYAMPKEEVDLKLTYDQINKYDSPYNTYLHPGLPAGPICCPSLNAFNWAIYPESTDYFYFVSDSSGYNLFGRNLREHNQNVAKAEASYTD